MAAFENLVINRLIVHEIFSRNDAGTVPPIYSDELADLTELGLVGRQQLSDRIVSSIGNSSHSIQMDIVQTGEGSIFSFATPLFCSDINNKEFISISKEIANKLSNSLYTKNIPGGAVVIFSGTVGARNQPYLGIIKAEKHGGFNVNHDGEKNVFLYLDDLFLSPTQKLYKISMMIEKKSSDTIVRTADDFETHIFDSLYTQTGSQTASNYFYDTFMGCAYQKTSDLLTLDFFQHTKDFITKKTTLSGEDIVDRMSALYTYLKVDNETIISVDDFASKYLPSPQLQDAYVNYMQSKKVPMNSIHKDLEKLKHKLKHRKIEFTSNVRIYAPIENFKDYFNIVEKDEESTTVKIKGAIKNEN